MLKHITEQVNEQAKGNATVQEPTKEEANCINSNMNGQHESVTQEDVDKMVDAKTESKSSPATGTACVNALKMGFTGGFHVSAHVADPRLMVTVPPMKDNLEFIAWLHDTDRAPLRAFVDRVRAGAYRPEIVSHVLGALVPGRPLNDLVLRWAGDNFDDAGMQAAHDMYGRIMDVRKSVSAEKFRDYMTVLARVSYPNDTDFPLLQYIVDITHRFTNGELAAALSFLRCCIKMRRTSHVANFVASIEGMSESRRDALFSVGTAPVLAAKLADLQVEYEMKKAAIASLQQHNVKQAEQHDAMVANARSACDKLEVDLTKRLDELQALANKEHEKLVRAEKEAADANAELARVKEEAARECTTRMMKEAIFTKTAADTVHVVTDTLSTLRDERDAANAELARVKGKLAKAHALNGRDWIQESARCQTNAETERLVVENLSTLRARRAKDAVTITRLEALHAEMVAKGIVSTATGATAASIVGEEENETKVTLKQMRNIIRMVRLDMVQVMEKLKAEELTKLQKEAVDILERGIRTCDTKLPIQLDTSMCTMTPVAPRDVYGAPLIRAFATRAGWARTRDLLTGGNHRDCDTLTNSWGTFTYITPTKIALYLQAIVLAALDAPDTWDAECLLEISIAEFNVLESFFRDAYVHDGDLAPALTAELAAVLNLDADTEMVKGAIGMLRRWVREWFDARVPSPAGPKLDDRSILHFFPALRSCINKSPVGK